MPGFGLPSGGYHLHVSPPAQAEGTAGFREQGMDFLRWRGAGMADPQGSSAAVRDR